nr:EOG090X0IC1 [Artemia franciscana]
MATMKDKKKFKIKLKIMETKGNCNVEYIPCKISFSGSAKVTEYFTSNISSNVNDKYKVSLHGYPLHGENISIPKGYVGAILEPTNEDSSLPKLKPVSKFDQFRYWNWDMPTSKDDTMQQIKQWTSITKVLMEDDEQDASSSAK